MTDVVDLAERALHELAETVALIGPGQWNSPTPCELWTVQELLEHVVAVNRKYQGIAGGDDWLPGVEDVDLGADPARTYRDTIRPFLTAWREPGARERQIRTQGEQFVPADVVLSAHLRETLVHGWDLAVAIGRSAPFDDEVVRACLDRVAGTPGIRPAGIGYADATPAASDAAPIVRLAAFFGRDTSAWG